MLECETEAELLDGQMVSLRCLDAEDADAVRRLHEQLDDQDRYFRFFTQHPAHLAELVHELTEPGKGRTAIGAFANGRLIGVANFAACEDPSVADVAIVVDHEYHLHGVGTALLRQLAHLARRQGVRRFAADILSANRAMLKVLSDIGWPHRGAHQGTVVHLEIELPETC